MTAKYAVLYYFSTTENVGYFTNDSEEADDIAYGSYDKGEGYVFLPQNELNPNGLYINLENVWFISKAEMKQPKQEEPKEPNDF